MECNKWEEIGLLYVSKELPEPDASEFEKHLAACLLCSNEHSQYTSEKKQFFTTTLLGEPTPEHLDKKIFALCSRPMVPTSIGIFSMSWAKRAVFSALVFSLGIGAGGYFTFAYFTSKSPANYEYAKNTAPSAVVTTDTIKLALDSAKKELPDLLKPGVRRVNTPQIAPQGIITVDLKKD
jgi:hypothetical protein